jgi:ribosome-binding factor A
MGGYTYKRIESNILNVLNHTLIHDIYDEELKRASFTNVKLSNDSSVA